MLVLFLIIVDMVSLVTESALWVYKQFAVIFLSNNFYLSIATMQELMLHGSFKIR